MNHECLQDYQKKLCLFVPFLFHRFPAPFDQKKHSELTWAVLKAVKTLNISVREPLVGESRRNRLPQQQSILNSENYMQYIYIYRIYCHKNHVNNDTFRFRMQMQSFIIVTILWTTPHCNTTFPENFEELFGFLCLSASEHQEGRNLPLPSNNTSRLTNHLGSSTAALERPMGVYIRLYKI